MAKKEYIERDAAKKEFLHAPMTEDEKILVIRRINSVPAADVVEVVRCKEFRYFYGGPMKCCMNHVGVVLTDENGFCHHAKRREDEGGDA